MDMDISGSRRGLSFVVKVSGRMDAVSAPQFEEKCVQWIEAGETHLVVDMGGLEYVSSAGLRSILAVGRKLRSGGGSLIFCNLRGMVHEVFEISGFVSIFPVHNTLETALAHG